jgi:N-acetylglutamate synthase-like GNAT family acetyltransferase
LAESSIKTSDPRSTMELIIRTHMVPGDLGEVVRLHGILYAKEYGLDNTFEAYVAGPLSEFVLAEDRKGQKIWVVEAEGRVAGCIAIVRNADGVAQLRWFILTPETRGRGLGKRLMEEAVNYCREAGYRRIILWTFSELETAIALYRRWGFEKTEEKPHHIWGRDLVEEKYELSLD